MVKSSIVFDSKRKGENKIQFICILLLLRKINKNIFFLKKKINKNILTFIIIVLLNNNYKLLIFEILS